jgi:VWFA-related protein
MKYYPNARLPSGSLVRRAVLVVLVTLAAVSLQAQNQPTFRTGTNYVRVDMYASRDGQSVADLQTSDVELLEDGVPQTIEAFEHVQVGAPGSSRARVFVLSLDTYNTQIEGSSTMRLPLIKVLDRIIAADDMVAVMTPEMSPSEMTFGRKATVISNIMQSDWTWARRGRTERRDQKEALYDACYPAVGANGNTPANEMKARRREKLTLDALDGVVADLGSVRDERKAILTVSDGWVLFRGNQDLAAAQKGRDQGGLVERLLRRPTKEKEKEKAEETGGSKDVNYVECEADRVALAALDHSQRLRSLTENANRSNISFYAIDPHGITSDPASDADRSAGRRDTTTNAASRQDSLRFIADNTDGMSVVNTNNFDPFITRIVDDVSSYYLMAYTSSNTRLDGRFRSITVRVKQDGVKVRARRGYRGPTADNLISGTAPASGSAGRAAATASPATGFNARAPFRIRTSTWLHTTSGDARQGAFWIVGELDYQTRRQLEWTAGAEAEVVVLGADGREVMSRTVGLKADEGPFSIQVPETGAIDAGEYAVRVRIRSEADEKTELTDTVRVILREGPALGEAVMWRRGLSTGPRYLRTADPRFMRSDRLKLELATSAATPAKARILDRNQNELSVPAQVSERADPSGDFRWIVVDATLSPFAAGDYSVEVTQGREKRVTEFKVVP